MKAIRILLAEIRKADQNFDLFHHGDKIVIGLSGGKDSIALTYLLNLYRKFSHTDFIIQPVILDLGFEGFNPEPLREFVESLGLTLYVSNNQEVYPILKAHQDENKHLPCSICSRMKKAAINKVAHELGFNKVAFAHHGDDAIETLIMNEIYGGRIATFAPRMHLERADIEFIRPLIYAYEKDIIRLIKEEKLPIFPSLCPADKTTTREDIKNILKDIYHKYPMSHDSFLSMLENYEHYDVWDDDLYYQINQNGLSLKPVITKDDALKMMDIRFKVFVKGQNVPYEEEFVPSEEKEAKAFLICINKEAIGTIRYREKEDGLKIERFAILDEYQNKGYGKETLIFLSSYLYKKYNPKNIYLNAQYHLLSFYQKCGYLEEGETFYEANIKHIKMNLKEAKNIH